MKTTPDMIKARRKQRRAESRVKANKAFIALSEMLNLNTSYVEDKGYFGMPSFKGEETGDIVAILRLGRRLRPMLDCARRELDRRYKDEAYRRRRELKKQYKAAVLAKLAQKAQAEVVEKG